MTCCLMISRIVTFLFTSFKVISTRLRYHARSYRNDESVESVTRYIPALNDSVAISDDDNP